ncbi:MAG: hypothetical protein RLZZ352_2253 [Pseudomonadota bacterium]|jgi:hypothetical protein
MKTDARQDTIEVLQAFRAQAHREHEMTWEEFASIVGVHRLTMLCWFRCFRVDTAELRPIASARGCSLGSGLILRTGQKVLETLGEDSDLAQGLPFALWSRSAIPVVAQSRFGVYQSLGSSVSYLQCRDFTPQHPAKRVLELRLQQMQNWLNEEDPVIEPRVKAERAKIHCAVMKRRRAKTRPVRSFASAGLYARSATADM